MNKYISMTRNSVNITFRLYGTRFLFALLFLCAALTTQAGAKGRRVAQPQNPLITPGLKAYLDNYQNLAYSNIEKTKVDSIKIAEAEKVVHLYLSPAFAMQPFTQELVGKVYAEVQPLMLEPYNTYSLVIYATEKPIQSLVPIDMMAEREPNRDWGDIDFDGNPWVSSLSLPYFVTKGLGGRHFCMWASHGKYYNQEKAEWQWQRPRLYCTTEDLFTQTFMIPYLFPMLENAGGVVYTPRERDWQKNEVVVDNDTPHQQGEYSEEDGKHKWKDAGTGFANMHTYLTDSINPFREGTCRMVKSQSSNTKVATITWLPVIPADGDYAVYVSYKTMPNSVSDAKYTVKHQGMTTRFRVNQTMGGGIWVYLGTFHFTAGQSADNCVILTNQSDDPGIVTADAVRIGGGMGNVMRTDSLKNNPPMISGLPRFLEGARYSAQWSGLPPKIYLAFNGSDDYKEDIRTRPTAGNYVANGSLYHPGDSGLCVPLELELAVHSDAGITRDMNHIGTLGVYTTNTNEGLTSAGLSRLTSRDLCDMVMTQVCNDISRKYGYWNRRSMWDKNYGETREPYIPGIILETLSHQNFSDMVRGHDPAFKFTLARAIYKGILRYMASMHHVKLVTQPLPVRDVAVNVESNAPQMTLSWTPENDPLDATAVPESYIVYTSTGDAGYDNGTLVENATTYTMQLQEGVLYKFKVAALNDGGCSMPSQEVCACYNGADAPRLLLVDGFNRVAGPQVVNTDAMCGFDMEQDPGVADFKTAGYCGYQQYFNRDGLGRETSRGTGFSGAELEGMILAGNTHDYPTRHAKDFLAGGKYTIASCCSSALGKMPTAQYQLIDLIFGAQKVDGYSSINYKTFTDELQQQITAYTQNGGNVMVSGAYIGSDMQQPQEYEFTSRVLKYQFATVQHQDSTTTIQGMNATFGVFRYPNEINYWIRNADVIQPSENAYSMMVYADSNLSAGTAYQGSDYRVMAFGFPLECIDNASVRQNIMNSSLNFLLSR